MCTVDFLSWGTTINDASFCESLNKLCHVIQNKKQGMIIHHIVLHRIMPGHIMLLKPESSAHHLVVNKWKWLDVKRTVQEKTLKKWK